MCLGVLTIAFTFPSGAPLRIREVELGREARDAEGEDRIGEVDAGVPWDDKARLSLAAPPVERELGDGWTCELEQR